MYFLPFGTVQVLDTILERKCQGVGLKLERKSEKYPFFKGLWIEIGVIFLGKMRNGSFLVW